MPDGATLGAWLDAYGLLAMGCSTALSFALVPLVVPATKSVSAQGKKGGFALAISAVAWFVVFLVASWIFIFGAKPVSSHDLKNSALALLFLPLSGWFNTHMALWFLFSAGDWIRHRIMRK